MADRRKLTKDEILKILDWLTPKIFNSQFPESSKDIANGWRRILWNQLTDEKFDPTKLDFIRDRIKHTFLSKMISSGTPVGKITGTSVGEKSTQFTLKLKSNASTSSSGTSVKVSTLFQSLINAPRNPPDQQIEIRFKNKLTFTDLYIRRREFQRLYLDAEDFILSSDIVNAEDNYADWYEPFKAVYGYGFDDITSKLCLQIRFDVQKLYNYHLTLAEIAGSLIEDNNVFIQVFFSPQDLGIIDIYPRSNYSNNPNFLQKLEILQTKTEIEVDDGWELDDEEDITEDEVSYSRSRSRSVETFGNEMISEKLEDIVFTAEDSEELFLETIVRPMFSVNNFGGNDNIGEVFVAWTPYGSTIKKINKIANAYEIEFNPNVLRHTGITEKEVLDWFRTKSWIITSSGQYRYILSNLNNKSPSEELLEALSDIEQFESVIKVYLEATSGFPELIIHPEVDTDHSYTNSSKIMKDIFGIEVARKTMMNMFLDILSGDHYVSPVHPQLIVDHMVFTGEVMPMTRSSFRYQHVGAFEQAMFEQHLPAVTEAAMFPTTESARKAATATVFGSAPPIGTGSVSLYEASDYTEVKRQKEFEESNTKESERQKLLKTVNEIEEPIVYDLIDLNIPEFESLETSDFVPKILLPGEIDSGASVPQESVQTIPADSVFSSTVEVETTAPSQPVAKPARRIQRPIKMK